MRYHKEAPMSLEDFNQELREKNLIGYWMIPNRSDGFREPKPSFGPYLELQKVFL